MFGSISKSIDGANSNIPIGTGLPNGLIAVENVKRDLFQFTSTETMKLADWRASLASRV